MANHRELITLVVITLLSFSSLMSMLGTNLVVFPEDSNDSSSFYNKYVNKILSVKETPGSSAAAAALLQNCIDEYTSKGSWVGGRWVVSTKMDDACPSFEKYPQPKDISLGLTNLKIGFMGDSTTRSDLHAWEQTFGCPISKYDDAKIFQKKNEDGTHVCGMPEQSVNLTKCGIPSLKDMPKCPAENSPSFRYFYKVYPWTSLDRWYFENQPEKFADLDALVISIGRWFPYAGRKMNVTEELDNFLIELKKVYSGLILFQGQYAKHTIAKEKVIHPVNCTHGFMNDKYDCQSTVTKDRPKEDDEIRSLLIEKYEIAFLDRWNISKTLPMEHYDTWLCGKPAFHSWYCDHHLGFVAIQHLRLIASVIMSY